MNSDDVMTSQEFSHGLVIAGFVPPLKLSHFKLAAFDMDSTLINIECVDEIADAAGRKAEVAAITEAAMRGEITDYKDSLRRRVALLAGVPVSAMEEVLAQRLQLNPGASELTAALKAAGCKLLLVSGGFTFFTDHIRDRLHMDFARSNVLEVAQTCAALGITPKQAMAVGDGANDLPMMLACSEAGGLSVAFHAKPKVREQAMVAINTGGLDRVLELMA
jgi:phosphoserine phosphatase